MKFWFRVLRNAFITVTERRLMLPRKLTKRLFNHARPSDVTEVYANDWTVKQFRETVQRIPDRIDKLKGVVPPELEQDHLHASLPDPLTDSRL